MMKRKLLNRMKVCGAISHMMKDEFIVRKHQVDGTRLLISIIYYLYIDLQFFCHICITGYYCSLYLLSFIVTMYWIKFLY